MRRVRADVVADDADIPDVICPGHALLALHAAFAVGQEQVGYIDFGGSYEPEPRLRDMDVQGIDQVMIIPTDIDTYPS